MRQWTRTISRHGLRPTNEHPLLWDFCRAGAPPAIIFLSNKASGALALQSYKATRLLRRNTLHHRAETGEFFIEVLITAVDVIETIDFGITLGMKRRQYQGR